MARLRLWNNALMDILQCFGYILEVRADRRAVESVCEYLLRVDGGKFCLGIKPQGKWKADIMEPDLNIHGTVKEGWWI